MAEAGQGRAFSPPEGTSTDPTVVYLLQGVCEPGAQVSLRISVSPKPSLLLAGPIPVYFCK